MANDPVGTSFDNMMTFFPHHAVRPEPPEMKASPPGESKADCHNRVKDPALQTDEMPELIPLGKRKQEDQSK